MEFQTVYVMVDNRDLANHKRQDPSLPHWPAAARWWHSRLKLIGPHKEKTEFLLFPISATTRLHHVHPTWAGTFVLAALVAMFPGLNFFLLVSLFEVEDLWTEAFLARFPAHSDGGIPQAYPHGFAQNAGLFVIFRSSHPRANNCDRIQVTMNCDTWR